MFILKGVVLKEEIKKDLFVKVYKTSVCHYCSAAVDFLASMNVPFEEISLDDDQELRMKLSQENGGWRTVPMIFIGKEFIGGFNELMAVHRGGRLMEMLGQDE